MSFRTVVISNPAKISYKNRFLVVKQDMDEKYSFIRNRYYYR